MGKLAREIERQMTTLAAAFQQKLLESLSKARQIVMQTKHGKTIVTQSLYSWHAPETDVIAKGKARTTYEFGVKVGIASTLKGNLVLGARSIPNNPYYVHTLAEQLEQASFLSNSTIKDVYDDLGYRGVDQDNPDVSLKHRGKYKRLSKQERRLLKQIQSVEPIMDQLKSYHPMDRCHPRAQSAMPSMRCVAQLVTISAGC